MQGVFRNLLAAAAVAWIASCTLNDHGLGAMDASRPSSGTAGGAAGGAAGHPSTGGATGTSAAGSSGIAGDGGDAGSAAAPAGAAGTDVTPTAGSSGGDTAGAAGDSPADAAADTATSGDAGAGGAGTDASAGSGGASGAAGVDAGAGGAGGAGGTTSAPQPGCSDGTREGYTDLTKYPDIAACAGAWDEPGLSSTDSLAPECDRRAGNDGDKTDGHGCSVADLCAQGWRVCETAHAVTAAAGTSGCTDALAPSGMNPVFFVTRQRANGLVCDAANDTGTNNVYGCGTFGSAADKSCSPFTHMLRDSDCQANYPWQCSDGPNGTSTDEYDVITKVSSARGGALCCKD